MCHENGSMCSDTAHWRECHIILHYLEILLQLIIGRDNVHDERNITRLEGPCHFVNWLVVVSAKPEIVVQDGLAASMSWRSVESFHSSAVSPRLPRLKGSASNFSTVVRSA